MCHLLQLSITGDFRRFCKHMSTLLLLCQARGGGAGAVCRMKVYWIPTDHYVCSCVLVVALLKGLSWCSTVELWSLLQLQVQANILQILDMSLHSIVASEADYLAAQWAELPQLQSLETVGTSCCS